jgi:hypothetical protein
MSTSLRQQILDFNREVHAFEGERKRDLEAAIDIIQSLDTKGLASYANHLRDNLAGIMKAKSQEELDLYYGSFNDVLDSLVIDEDVLGIYDCLLHFRHVIDLTSARYDEDQKHDDEIRAFTFNTRLKWIDIGLKEFFDSVNELAAGLERRLKLLIEEEASEAAINRVESGLKKLALIKKEMRKARLLAEEMLKAKNRQELEEKRLILAKHMRNIQELGGARQGGKDLQNLFTRIGRRHVDALYEARSSYLPEPVSTKRKAVDFAWIAVGATLTAVGVAMTAPVAVIALGIAGIAYGTIDLAKEITEPVAKHAMPKLGKREPVRLRQPTRLERAKSIGKKALPIVLSALALGAGIAALAFPPAAIPLAAVGLGLALVGGIMFGMKLYNERQEAKRIASQHAMIQNKYAVPVDKSMKKPAPEPQEELTEEASKKLTKTVVSAKSSEAKIDMFLLGHHFDQPLSENELGLLRERQSPSEEVLSVSKGVEPPQQESREKSEMKKKNNKPEDEHFNPKGF